MDDKPLIMIHCQYVYGIGHFVRIIELIKALLPFFRIKLISGGEPINNFPIPEEICFIQLPPVFKQENEDNLRVVNAKFDLQECFEQREKILQEQIDIECPSIFISEHFPFGLLFENEVLSLIDKVKKRNINCKIVCSVRDIITSVNGSKNDIRTCEIINKYYDLVLIHGDQIVCNLETTFPFFKIINRRIVYTGYITQHLDNYSNETQVLKILVSVAAGRIGSELIDMVLNQAHELKDNFNCEIRMFFGAFQEHKENLHNLNSDLVQLSSFNRIDYIEALRKSDILICMGGYNTIIEAMSLNKSVVVYKKKFMGDNEEQSIRIYLFENLGMLVSITKEDLENNQLILKIADSIKLLKKQKLEINFKGAIETTEHLKKLVGL